MPTAANTNRMIHAVKPKMARVMAMLKPITPRKIRLVSGTTGVIMGTKYGADGWAEYGALAGWSAPGIALLAPRNPAGTLIVLPQNWQRMETVLSSALCDAPQFGQGNTTCGDIFYRPRLGPMTLRIVGSMIIRLKANTTASTNNAKNTPQVRLRLAGGFGPYMGRLGKL